jgi:hypothetical protein
MIKRKDNNKKVAETEIFIEALAVGKAKQEKAT